MPHLVPIICELLGKCSFLLFAPYKLWFTIYVRVSNFHGGNLVCDLNVLLYLWICLVCFLLWIWEWLFPASLHTRAKTGICLLGFLKPTVYSTLGMLIIYCSIKYSFVHITLCDTYSVPQLIAILGPFFSISLLFSK